MSGLAKAPSNDNEHLNLKRQHSLGLGFKGLALRKDSVDYAGGVH